MRLLIVYPAIMGLNNGNLVTARRWQRCLNELGHSVETAATFDDAGRTPDLVIALHAIKSSDAIKKCKAVFPAVPVVVVLTGTDIYGPQSHAPIEPVLKLADRIVVLQSATARDVGQPFQDKVRVIYQAVTPIDRVLKKSDDCFEVCVVGHLRQVKDPFQTAKAVRDLPLESKVRVTQIGAAMNEQMRTTAEMHDGENRRFRWIGEVRPEEAFERIASSHLLVNSSKVEGGAAVICEAVVAGTPILATPVAGNVGCLGEGYEGFFEVGNSPQLREMLLRAENDAEFYQRLKDQCESRKFLFDPDFEKGKWAELIGEFEP